MSRTSQKWMVRLLVGAVVAGIGWQIGEAMLYAPLQKDRKDISRYKKSLAKLRQKAERDAPVVAEHWRSLAARTLGADEATVKNALTHELTHLAEISGLQKPSIRPRKAVQNKKAPDVLQVPISVMAQGTLDKVARFLGLVYELPYLVRVRDMRISPTGGKTSKLVSLSLKIESLVLLESRATADFVRDVKRFDLEANAKDRPPRDPPVLNKPMAAYVALAEREPFHAFIPPPPPRVVRKPPPTRRTTRSTLASRRKTSRKPAPAADPRGYTKVTSSLSFPGGQEVGLTDTKKKTRTIFRVGDALALLGRAGAESSEERIILVHPYGFVTQNGEERRFYALDTLLNQAQRVGANTDPAIRAALAKLDAQPSE